MGLFSVSIYLPSRLEIIWALSAPKMTHIFLTIFMSSTCCSTLDPPELSGTLNMMVFFRVSSYYIVNSVSWSHALVNGPTSKRPASDGGLGSGQLLMMWSAVLFWLATLTCRTVCQSPLFHGCFVPTDPSS